MTNVVIAVFCVMLELTREGKGSLLPLPPSATEAEHKKIPKSRGVSERFLIVEQSGTSKNFLDTPLLWNSIDGRVSCKCADTFEGVQGEHPATYDISFSLGLRCKTY
jgi:hypothetical protein